MTIREIGLSWFRGAAETVVLDANGRSVVVYGANGSGKSSFVDAIEYVLCDGRVKHLAHEYSGKRQEKGLPNTHMPKDEHASLHVVLTDKSEVRIAIQRDGRSSRTEKGTPPVTSWDYRRTVLRQHEVSGFIHGTKADKYSALLPLLGLDSLERMTGNLNSLADTVSEEAHLVANRSKLRRIAEQRTETFASQSDPAIAEIIERLHAEYCPGRTATTDPAARCKELAPALRARIDASSDELRCHVALQALGSISLASHIGTIREANARFAKEAEPLVRERVEVLTSARAFAGRLGSREEVVCPACGRSVEVGSFRDHV